MCMFHCPRGCKDVCPAELQMNGSSFCELFVAENKSFIMPAALFLLVGELHSILNLLAYNGFFLLNIFMLTKREIPFNFKQKTNCLLLPAF